MTKLINFPEYQNQELISISESLSTKITTRVWFILWGIKLKSAMRPENRIQYYKDQLNSLKRFSIKHYKESSFG